MNKTIGLISANYSDNEFGPLTESRPLISLLFGGRYRLLDFTMSNLVNSGIRTVGLITPDRYRSIIDHVGSGKEWSLDRKIAGLFILPGSNYRCKKKSGNFLLKDLIRNRIYLERGRGELVIVTTGNKIFNLNFRPIAAQHFASGSDITMFYKKIDQAEDRAGNYLTLNDKGEVIEITDTAKGNANYFMDCFAINRQLLLKFLDSCQAIGYVDVLDIIEESLGKVKVNTFEFKGYLGIIDNLFDYMKCSQDLLNEEIRNELFDVESKIYTKIQDSAPTKYLEGATISNSLIPTGCTIEGNIENSILFRGVKVAKGAVVRNSVIMQNSTISADAVLENVICDKFVTISENIKLFGSKEKPLVIGKGQEI